MLSQMHCISQKLKAGLIACLGILGTVEALAQSYPVAPIRIIVAYAAGGGTDSIARAVAHGLSARLGQPITIENKPGGGGSIGTTAGALANADGYTFVLGSNGTMVLNPLLYPHIKYQVDRDFVAVSGIASIPYLVAANPKVEANDIQSLVALGRSKKLTFASPGNGTTNHLVGVMLESMAKIDMIHVPYRGASLAMNDVVSGQVNFLSGDLSTLMPMVNAGKLKPIAVTGSRRVASLPNIPTVAESGYPTFEATGWFALFAPKNTPQSIIERVSNEMAIVLKERNVMLRLHDLGGSPMSMTPEQVSTLVRSETTKWRKMISNNHVTADALQ
jgi:tripartite-type tricarboxylate transporter receptor subunit TctC